MYAQNSPDRISAILLTFAALMHTILSSSVFLAELADDLTLQRTSGL
jgi:hypothetical protein